MQQHLFNNNTNTTLMLNQTINCVSQYASVFTRAKPLFVFQLHAVKNIAFINLSKCSKALLFVITSIVLLITPFTSHADFRKALSAYQNRDGQAMLKEVQDAVDKKNDDGLVLFISALQLDNILATSRFYVGANDSNIMEETIANTQQPSKTNLQTLINEGEITALYKTLGEASKKSSLDAQYEYFLLFYGDAYHTYTFQTVEIEQKRINQLLSSMKLLAKKGYAKAAFYLSYPQTIAYGDDKKNDWYHKANKLGYKVEFNKEANGYLVKTKKSSNTLVLSIQRYSNWASTFVETNYFLDVYADGNVNFSRGILADMPKNKQSIIQHLSPNDLKNLVKSIKDLGFYQQPISNTNGYGDNMGNQPSFGGYSITRTYLVTLREKGKERTLTYNISEEDSRVKDIPLFFTQIFELLHKTIPTQFYRCGLDTKRDYYQHCIARDF